MNLRKRLVLAVVVPVVPLLFVSALLIMSVGYIGSGGRKFSTLLPEQRKKTDAQLEEFRRFISTFGTSTPIMEHLEKLLSMLNQIEDIRTRVDNLSI